MDQNPLSVARCICPLCSRGIICWSCNRTSHYDVMAWNYFPHYWPYVRGFIVWTSCWTNSLDVVILNSMTLMWRHWCDIRKYDRYGESRWLQGTSFLYLYLFCSKRFRFDILKYKRLRMIMYTTWYYHPWKVNVIHKELRAFCVSYTKCYVIVTH